MRYRPLGNTGLTTSEIGFGCARIGGMFQRTSRVDLVALLRAAHDSGITFFDTADMYTQGESERLVGDAFRGCRDHVVIATKFGYKVPSRKRFIGRVKPLLKPVVGRLGLTSHAVPAGLRGGVSDQDFSPAYITAAVEMSLRRLKTDYIDIYQLHDPPTDVLQAGAFIEPLDRLREQGKIRQWGVAARQPEDACAALAYASPASIQVGLNLLEQDALAMAVPRAGARGAAVIARQVFASGLLTRPVERLTLDDMAPEPGVAARKRDRLINFARLASRLGRTPIELALQFALSRREVSVVLVGVSRPDHLAACWRAYEAPRMSADENRLIATASQPGQ
jgi:aryl-alcohol dehydrogenase-like predicted oxidoreductase